MHEYSDWCDSMSYRLSAARPIYPSAAFQCEVRWENVFGKVQAATAEAYRRLRRLSLRSRRMFRARLIWVRLPGKIEVSSRLVR